MWSLGCLLYTLFNADYMFIPDRLFCRDTLLDLTICFGKLPDPWWGLWKDREECYDGDGQLKPDAVRPMGTGDFEPRLRKLPRSKDRLEGMQDEEYAWFRRLMYEIFKLNPKERMVAKEVVRYLPPSWKVGTPQAWGLSYLGRRAIWVAVDGGCAVGCAARGFSRTRFTGAHSMPIPRNNPCHRLAQSAINSIMQVSPWKTK